MSELPKTKKIAITGSMGSGKSSASEYLRSLGYAVFDSDATVHKLYETDEAFKQTMVFRFGNEILHNNVVSTAKLRAILVKFPKQRRVVENLVHPYVLSEWLKFCTSTTDTVIFGEVPLLFEVGWEHYFDEIWCVYTEPHVINERLKKYRKLDEETLEAMLKWQMHPQKKCAMSTVVLYNNTEIKSLYDQIDIQLSKV
jgi:dephospho-CoA kinase